MLSSVPRPDFVDDEYPADPYPGARPSRSFVHRAGAGYALTPDSTMPSGWRLGDGAEAMDLDGALRGWDVPPLSRRYPVLAYGSNANPSKITWIREHCGLSGPVVVMRAECHGVEAVWSAGYRQRDGQRPAVLAGVPGGRETHALWWATADQRQVLDRVEGRGERYRLCWVRVPIRLENQTELAAVLAYTARPEATGADVPAWRNRSPLLVNGHTVRCRDLAQDAARELVGTPAESDGLDVTEVDGEP